MNSRFEIAEESRRARLLPEPDDGAAVEPFFKPLVEPLFEPLGEMTMEPTTQPTTERMIARARLLWSDRVLLRRALAVGLLAGVLFARLIPSEYQSTVQLMPPDNQSNGGLQMLAALAGKTGGAMGSLAGDALGVKSAGSLFIGILRSRTVQDRLVDRFQLRKVYRAKLEENAGKRLAENTVISEDRKNGIITLTVSDHERQQARALATAYVEELNRLAAELSTSSAHRERVFLEERLAAVKQDLDQATRELGEFSSQNATIDLKDEGRAMLEEAAALQGELIAAESERQSLEAIYTPVNYRVRAVAARVSELQNQLRKLGGEGEENTKEYGGGSDSAGSEDSSKDKGKEKSNRYDDDDSDSLYPSLRKLPLLGMKYAELYRRTKIQEAVFETLTQQYEVAKVQEAKETPSVKMLDEASLPELPSFPPRTLITLFCTGACFVGAAAWIVARQRWQRIDADNPKKRFSREVFDGVFDGVKSVMPWARRNGSRWQAATHRVWVRLNSRSQGNSRSSQGREGRGDRQLDDQLSGDQLSDDQAMRDDGLGGL
jgi:uncharacterized protein involved in exopolysaccharide biosynthesis